MSTKCTVAHGDNFHLYNDLFDQGVVCLQLQRVEFNARTDVVTVKIPVHIWEFLRSFPGVDLSDARKTDQELEQEAIAQVDERLNTYRSANTDSVKPLLGISGALVMGSIDLPRDQQIFNAVEYKRTLREHQRDVLSKVEALRKAQAL